MQLRACVLRNRNTEELLAAQGVQQLRQHGAISRPVNEPWPHDADRQALLAMILQRERLGLVLGTRVGVERLHGRRDRLIRAEVVAALVNAERTDVNEPRDVRLQSRVEQESEGRDVGGASKLLQTAPVTHFSPPQLKTQSAPSTPRRSASASSRSPGTFSTPHSSSHRVSLEGRTSALTRCPRRRGLLGGMATDQAGRAGDEDRLGAGRGHTFRASPRVWSDRVTVLRIGGGWVDPWGFFLPVDLPCGPFSRPPATKRSQGTCLWWEMSGFDEVCGRRFGRQVSL